MTELSALKAILPQKFIKKDVSGLFLEVLTKKKCVSCFWRVKHYQRAHWMARGSNFLEQESMHPQIHPEFDFRCPECVHLQIL